MMLNPIARLKRRLSAAIDWRVTQEYDRERDLIRATNSSMVDATAFLSDQISGLNQRIVILEKRIAELEGQA